jgi:hypothetical protein
MEATYLLIKNIKNSLLISVFIIIHLFTPLVFSQNENPIIHRVFLTANTADISSNSNFIPAIEKLLSKTNESFSLILNGDLIKGKISDKNEGDVIQNLGRLFSTVTQFDNGRIIVIPGDRDWADSGPDGWKNVRKLQKLIGDFNHLNVSWPLKKGCPGPGVISLTPDITLVTINTQWWNHPYNKPGPADADCKISTTNDFKEELEDIIDDESGGNLLIAGHFPVLSLGEYGGHFSARSHLFPLTEINDYLYLPLPIIGSFYPSYRKNIGTAMDISNENFENFLKLIGNIITHRQSLIYLSGHEYNLQILKKEKNYFINSGSPNRPGYTANDPDALYSESATGLIELLYYKNGKISSVVHLIKKDKNLNPDKEVLLFQSAIIPTESNIPVNDRSIVYSDSNKTVETSSSIRPDSVKIMAGAEYAAGWMHRLFFGDHYRDTWTTEVKIPYLKIDNTFNGLKPLKKGGGRQTKSLKFIAGNKMRYTFRSVNKDPIKALDYELRETIVADLVRDQTTTQYPYGALATDIMLNQLDVSHAHPKLYVLPNSDKLESYKEEYGNLFGMLEENPANPDNGEIGFAGASEIIRSHKLFRRLYKSHKNRVDTQNFAIARCFDMLVGDWGKHEDNWKWIGFKSNEGTIYKPRPRDRDHVFSRWDGVFPWLADREWAKPSGENFDYEISGLRSLMWQARHLDRFIASDRGRLDWIQAANFVQEKISDEVIEAAIKHMPLEVYELSGKEIEAKLKKRIHDLEKYAIKYYEMLAPEVDIVGSNDNEYFDVLRNEDGTVQVLVANLDNDQRLGNDVFYSRIFSPDETDEIRLYGLDGADVFTIRGKSKKSILIRIISGPGKDKISDTSTGGKVLIYEKGKKSEIQMGEESVKMSPSDQNLYNYNRTTFAYNTYFPLPYIAYDVDRQFVLGLNLELITQKFGKKDFNIKHKISGEIATAGTFFLGYDMRLHHRISEWDIAMGGFYANPNDFLYFYGLGNETVKDEDLFDQGYYQTHFKSIRVQGGFLNEFWKYSTFSGMIRYDNNQRQLFDENTILEDSAYYGSDNVNLAEVDLELDLDFRDDRNLPEDGMRFYLGHTNGLNLTDNNSNYSKTWSFIEYFASIKPFTLGLKFGGGGSYGNIPFYNLFTLGQNNYLRGYRSNRFTGEGMAYFDSELRAQLFDVKTLLVPLRIGVRGFYNTGRIFQSGEDSKTWHSGYGFGLYIVPLEPTYTFHISAAFSDEESLLITFGIGGAFK